MSTDDTICARCCAQMDSSAACIVITSRDSQRVVVVCGECAESFGCWLRSDPPEGAGPVPVPETRPPTC